jgi:hypothetical protein
MGVTIICPQCGHTSEFAGSSMPGDAECLLCAARLQAPEESKVAPTTGHSSRQRLRPASPQQNPVKSANSIPQLGQKKPAHKGPAKTASEAVASQSGSAGTSNVDLPIPLLNDLIPVEEPRSERVASKIAAIAPVVDPERDQADGPYEIADRDLRRCPNCTQMVKNTGPTCERCGADLDTGKVQPKVYQPLERDWHSGLSLESRVRLFVIAQLIVVPLGLLGAWWSGSLALFLGPWIPFTGLMAFLLGTYESVHLSRNKRGQVRVTKTWRICFKQQEPATYKLAEYEGVVAGQTHEVDFWDYLTAVLLLVFGIIPGVVWWLYAMQKVSFYVALGKDHGYPAVMLYKGWNEPLAMDIADTIRKADEAP